MDHRFRTSQESGAYLYRAGTQDQRRRHSACIGDSTRSNDWYGNGVNNLRHESNQAYHLTFSLVCMEGSAMSTSFHTLGNNGVGTGRFSSSGFGDRRSGGKPQDSVCFQFRDKRRGVEPHNRRHGLRRHVYHGPTLSVKVRQYCIASF
jgi:hypothetical protein